MIVLPLILFNAPAYGLLSSFAFAQDEQPTQRPSEESMFGTSEPTPSKTPSVAPSPKPVAQGLEEEQKTQDVEPGGRLSDAFASGAVTDNPLQIGGIYYQQAIVSAQDGTSLANTPITAPMQVDGYLDGRPNDRIRAFVDGRLLYDPTRDQYSNSTASGSSGVQTLQTQSMTSSAGVTGSTLTPNNPEVVLDQAWLKFDIDRTVFVTAGKQHVKWGVSKLWNPDLFLEYPKEKPAPSVRSAFGELYGEIRASARSQENELLRDRPFR